MINKIAALVERAHIISGIEYNMDDVKLGIDISGKAKYFYDYFHHKKN